MSDGTSQSSSGGSAGFDRTAGAQRWGEGGPEREKSRSLGPLVAAVLWSAAGTYDAVIWALAAVSLLSAISFYLTVKN